MWTWRWRRLWGSIHVTNDNDDIEGMYDDAKKILNMEHLTLQAEMEIMVKYRMRIGEWVS